MSKILSKMVKGNKKSQNNSCVEEQENVEVVTLQQIKDLFAEMFKQHEENIIKILAANNNIVNERIDKLNNIVDDLQHSLEFTEKEISDKINNVEKTQYDEHKSLKKKLRDLEDRSRRNNLRFDDITESMDETWEISEKKVKDLIKEKLQINQDVQIERAHRTRATQHQQEKKKPRTIVIKLLNYKDKVEILKNANKLKDTGIFINEDFCKETSEIRKGLWDKVLELRKKNKYAIIQYDRIVTREFKK